MSKQQLPEKISQARSDLVIDHPFFASLLLPMPMAMDKSVKTFATDGESIVFNPEWAEKLTDGETTFVLAHGVLHCVLDHMGRRGDMTPNRWNQAADYCINGILVSEKIGTMPSVGLLDDALVTRGGGTAEGVYALLPESSEQNGAGDSGGALDQVNDGGSEQGAKQVDDATAKQKSAELRVRVIQAKNAAKMQGKMSGGLERLIDDALKPVVDWKSALRRFLSERAKNEYSFAKPKRRFLAEDMYLPSLVGEKIGHIAIAVDCSASIYSRKELVNQFAAEINAIREDMSPPRIDIIYFDSKVTHTDTYLTDDEVKINAKGGGGTMFSPVFAHLNAHPEQPVACVFLTDMECDDFGPQPDFPVLWAKVAHSSYASVAPFGETVEIGD